MSTSTPLHAPGQIGPGNDMDMIKSYGGPDENQQTSTMAGSGVAINTVPSDEVNTTPDAEPSLSSKKKRKYGDDSIETRSKLAKLDEPTNETKSDAKKPVLSEPKVVHLRRLKGKIVQNCDIYIGRACNMGGWQLKQSKWFNPFSVKQYGRDGALDRYRKYIESNQNNLLNDLHELAGQQLGCWCKPARCHGDILCELFRREVQQSTKTMENRM